MLGLYFLEYIPAYIVCLSIQLLYPIIDFFTYS